MEETKIKSLLKQLGTPNLINLYGRENVDAIANILQDGVNEVKLVNLLFIKYGKQILSNKPVRLAILSKLSDQERGYVLDGIDDCYRSLSKDELVKLTKASWGRKRNSSHRLLDVLELSEAYLPVSYERPPSSITVTPKTFLFPHQRRVKDSMTRMLLGDESRILVHMPTGAGKTRTCIESIIDYWKAYSDRGMNIIWLAHSEELCEQAVETFEKLWEIRGDEKMTLCRFWSDHEVSDFSSGNNFIVASFQKLYSMISSNRNENFKVINDLKRTCGLIVVDEAHKAIAPTYKACISYLFNEGNTKLIGLTATPGRSQSDLEGANFKGSETDELAEFFDRNKVSLTNSDGLYLSNPIGFLQEEGFLSKIKRKVVTSNIKLELTDKERVFIAEFLEIPKSVLKKLANFDERNALILGEVAALWLKKRQIILFALSVAHAHLLTELLNLKGIEALCIDGTTPTSERKMAIQKYKNNDVSVLVNFGVLTTGFDAPNTNAVVITRPTASLVLYSQMIGRGLRGPKVGGNAECDLVDIEDNLIGFPSEEQAFNYFNLAWSK